MRIESEKYGSYRIIHVLDDLTVQTDLSELKKVVQSYIQEGERHFAFTFSERSYLYTKSLSIVVQCVELVRKRGGTVAIIQPNPDIVDTLRAINFDSIITIIPSRESLQA